MGFLIVSFSSQTTIQYEEKARYPLIKQSGHVAMYKRKCEIIFACDLHNQWGDLGVMYSRKGTRQAIYFKLLSFAF